MADPILTVAIVVFSLINDKLSVLVEKTQLPEDIINYKRDKTLESTVRRVLKERLGIETPYIEQVQTIGSHGRLPNQWSVCINYYCLVSHANVQIHSSSNGVRWLSLEKLNQSKLDYDHNDIIEACLHRLQNKSLYTSLPIFLLPEEFTLTELQKTYEIVLGFKVEKKSFRRRLLDAGFLKETGNIRRASHRPAQLYCLAQVQPYFFARIIEGVRESKNA